MENSDAIIICATENIWTTSHDPPNTHMTKIEFDKCTTETVMLDLVITFYNLVPKMGHLLNCSMEIS